MAKQDVESQVDYRRMLRLRWVVWGVPSLILLISHFQRIAPTTVVTDLMAYFQTTAAGLGGLGSVYFYIFAIMQIPSGILADTLGPRKALTAGAMIAGAGSYVFAAAGYLWVGYLGRFLVGLGMSVTLICIIKLMSAWFRDDEFATLTGLTLFWGSTGALLATTPFSIMVQRIGWRVSFQFVALVTVILAGLVWILVRDSPSLFGLPSAKEMAGEKCAAAGRHGHARLQFSLKEGLREALTNRAIWPTVFVSFGFYGTMMALKGMWITPYLIQVYDLNRAQAANYVFISLLAGLIGPVLVGYFSDRLGRRKLPILLFAPLYLLMWLMLAFWNGGQPPLTAVPVILFFMGIFCSCSALTWACAKEVSHPSLVGVAAGFANIGGFVGGALTQILFGYILDLKWQGTMVNGLRIYPVQAYQAAFLAVALVSSLSLISIFFIRETNCKNIYKDNLIAKSEGILYQPK